MLLLHGHPRRICIKNPLLFVPLKRLLLSGLFQRIPLTVMTQIILCLYFSSLLHFQVFAVQQEALPHPKNHYDKDFCSSFLYFSCLPAKSLLLNGQSQHNLTKCMPQQCCFLVFLLKWLLLNRQSWPIPTTTMTKAYWRGSLGHALQQSCMRRLADDMSMCKLSGMNYTTHNFFGVRHSRIAAPPLECQTNSCPIA